MAQDERNFKKNRQLGMSHGTATHQLRKKILFRLMQKCGEDVCFQCGEKIESVDELSIEHKTPWLDVSPDLFWDLDNVAFSHLSCNISAARKPLRYPDLEHGTTTMYDKRGCRCIICKAAHTAYRRKQRFASVTDKDVAAF